MKTKRNLFLFLGLLTVTSLLTTSCKKDYSEIVDEDAPTVQRAVYSDRIVNFNNWSTGTYTSARAVSDFGNISGFSSTEIARSYISSSSLRITYVKNIQDSGSGVVTSTDIADHSAYELTYDVKTHSAFDWARKGGKMGWGLLIGDGFTGGADASGGTGGSIRVTWAVSDSNPNDVYFRPYAYFVDQPGVYGHGWGARYPAAGSSLQKATWYTVKIFAQANTYANYNGKIKITINGTTVYNNNAFRWTTVHSKRFVKNLVLSCFRGGGTGSESSTDGFVYFDNFNLDFVSAVY